MNITEKLLEARKRIKETPIAKQGKNEFSKYDYFTPSQVSELVNTVCQELKLLTIFSLNKDEHGLFGKLEVLDIETTDERGKSYGISTEMRTEMPSITATNMTQQMGGCETYTKRYMLMSAFDITDNNLDFDSQDNRPKEAPKTTTEALTGEAPMNEMEADILRCTEVQQLVDLYTKLEEDEQKKYKALITKQKIKLQS